MFEFALVSFFSTYFTNDSVFVKSINEKGYGLVAAKDIMRNETIIEVQKEYLISDTDDFPFKKEFGDLNGEPMLAIRLLYEKFVNSEGFYHDYVMSLPTKSNSFMYWGTYNKRLFLENKLSALTFDVDYAVYYQVKEKLEELGLPAEMASLDNWIWACHNILSRGFDLGDKLVMVPAIDIANYNPNSKQFDGIQSENDALKLIAERDFYAGEEVDWSYGHKLDNFHLLTLYGIIVPHNIHDNLYFTYNSKHCFGEKTQNDCNYTLTKRKIDLQLVKSIIHELDIESALSIAHDDMNSLLKSNQPAKHQISLYKRYAQAVNYNGKLGLRQLRRALKRILVKNTNEELILRYFIGEREIMHAQKNLAYKKLMRILIEELGLVI